MRAAAASRSRRVCWRSIAELERRKTAIEAEIRRIRDGHIYLLDSTRIKERFLQISATARELLSDFREVEQNFRNLDREVRERIATWDGSKGELLEQIFGERDMIAAEVRPIDTPRAVTIPGL